jgi:hypothetical protein
VQVGWIEVDEGVGAANVFSRDRHPIALQNSDARSITANQLNPLCQAFAVVSSVDPLLA